MLVIRVLRVLRMTRVFKLARYSTGLQVSGAGSMPLCFC